MPEGDTIYRAAVQLRKVLLDQRIEAATARRDIENADCLVGQTVSAIESRGKHLMIHVSDQQLVHSHMGMTGSWHIYRPGEPWQKNVKSAALVLSTARFVVPCFSPKLIEIVTLQQIRRNDYLQRLGPDLLGPTPHMPDVIARFRTQDSVAVGEALLNQSIVSGIGNVYKSEVLFLENIHPATLVRNLSDDQIASMTMRAITLMRRNLNSHTRRTRPGPGQPLWVYHRSGKPCLRCGTSIARICQGSLARSTYYCATCQFEVSQPMD